MARPWTQLTWRQFQALVNAIGIGINEAKKGYVPSDATRLAAELNDPEARLRVATYNFATAHPCSCMGKKKKREADNAIERDLSNPHERGFHLVLVPDDHQTEKHT